MTRAKYKCVSVTKRAAYNKEKLFIYTASFQPVVGDSEENKRFFSLTPIGNIEIGQYSEDVFEPGIEYYVDFTKAE